MGRPVARGAGRGCNTPPNLQKRSTCAHKMGVFVGGLRKVGFKKATWVKLRIMLFYDRLTFFFLQAK